jgi:hypothetical protein
MATLSVFIGYCGSGKSQLLRMIAFACPTVKVVDEGFVDPQSSQDHETRGKVWDALKAGQDCAVGSMDCANPKWRVCLERAVNENAPGTRLAWVVLENNVERCNENCRRDKSKPRQVEGNIAQNERWRTRWTTPEDAFIMGVYPLP